MQDRHRTRLACAAVLAAALAVAAAAAADATAARRAESPGTWCGGTRWRLMSFNDPDRRRVDLRPVPATIASLARLTAPARVGTRRATFFERHVWRVHAVLDRYRIASNGEIVLILFSIDSGRFMNAYLPNPRCLSAKTRLRASIVAARTALTSRCPAVTAAWQLIGITTEVTGVGFWNPVRTTRGALPNGAELRPVVGFRIVAGCGVG